MPQLSVVEAAQRLPELVTAVTDGDKVVLTQIGQPVIKLVVSIHCPAAQQLRPLDTAKGLITVPDDFKAPLEDFAEYM